MCGTKAQIGIAASLAQCAQRRNIALALYQDDVTHMGRLLAAEAAGRELLSALLVPPPALQPRAEVAIRCVRLPANGGTRMIHPDTLGTPRPTLGALLVPQPSPWRYVALLVVGVVCGAALVGWADMPLWGASVLALALIAYPTMQSWRAVGARFGVPLMVLSVLLYLQGFHTVEHIAQYIEFHVLSWPPRQSSGLLSGLNVEIIHFVWNWSVLIV